jgi:uncharacterized protein
MVLMAKKIAVFADTHGNSKGIREAVQQNGPFDMLVHLGDGVGDGESVAAEMGIVFHGVEGNEDHFHFTTMPAEEIFSVGRWTFLAVHGHQMEINPYLTESLWNRHLKEMARRAKHKGAHVFLFGHTHKSMLRKEDGIFICNPGDQYLGSQVPPSFAVIEADDHDLEIRILQKEKDWITVHSLQFPDDEQRDRE